MARLCTALASMCPYSEYRELIKIRSQFQRFLAHRDLVLRCTSLCSALRADLRSFQSAPGRLVTQAIAAAVLFSALPCASPLRGLCAIPLQAVLSLQTGATPAAKSAGSRYSRAACRLDFGDRKKPDRRGNHVYAGGQVPTENETLFTQYRLVAGRRQPQVRRNPFITGPPPMDAMMVTPKTDIRNSSAGPVFSTSSTSGGVKTMSSITPNTPPISEPMKQKCSARVARPCMH